MANIALNKPSGGQLILSPEDGTSTETVTIPSVGVGKVLQVVEAKMTYGVTTSAAQATLVEASITPSSTSSKIIIAASTGFADNLTAGRDMYLRVLRGGSSGTMLNLYNSTQTQYFWCDSRAQVPTSVYLVDSPATTSSTTYGVYAYAPVSGVVNGCSLILMEVAA